jgi:hypothetical protein
MEVFVPLRRGEMTRSFIVMNTVIAVTLCVAAHPIRAQQPKGSPVLEECAPPGGLWGPGNQYRGKIEKHADRTAVMLSQNFSAPDKTQWHTNTPFSWAGGQYMNPLGVPVTVAPEGDGYKVTAKNYFAHFKCTPVAGAAR